MNMIDKVWEKEECDEEILRGVIMFILKDKDHSRKEDWRPVTVLNVSCKI